MIKYACPVCYTELPEWSIRCPVCGQRISRYAITKYSYSQYYFRPKKVIFNDPATIVLWNDGTKTVVKCQEYDTFDPEVGYAMCYLKKLLGNTGNFNNIFRNKAYLDAVEPIEEGTSSVWENFMTKCQNALITNDTINNELSVGYKKEEANE